MKISSGFFGHFRHGSESSHSSKTILSNCINPSLSGITNTQQSPKTAHFTSYLSKNRLITLTIYSTLFALLFPLLVLADTLTSPSYNIKMSTINSGGGMSTSTSYNVNQTIGQPIQGQFGDNGYVVKAGFQYIHPLIPFSFRISNLLINFGSLVPGTPSLQTNTLTVTTGSAFGYKVNVIEDHALRLDTGTATIPNTTCDLASPCTITTASPWTDNTRYCFGYNIQGTDVDTGIFVNSTYYRPFPMEGVDQPVTVMSDTGIATNSATTVTYKINISGTQAAGTYQNSLQYLAIPSF